MSVQTFFVVALVALLCVATSASSTPLLNTFSLNDIVSPRANAYRSRRTLMPFNYYSLPVCPVSKEKLKEDKNKEDLGEILMGNRLVPTNFQFVVGVDEKCKELCSTHFNKKEVRRANYMLENNYDVRMFLEGVPLVSAKDSSGTKTYRKGYALGPRLVDKAEKDEDHKIYNHLDFTISLAKDADKKYTIVGFHVTPQSFASVNRCDKEAFETESTTEKRIPLSKLHEEVDVKYTYSVKWVYDAQQYVIAHDLHEAAQKRGHKIAALYGVLLAVLAGVLVAFVMLRTVRKDLAIYLDEELDESEMREESGWKLVRGDVFRSPPYAVVLATMVGAGCQIAVTVLATMLLCATGCVDPTLRGHFLTAIIVVFLFTHTISGFATSRLLKLFGMDSWKTAILCMAAFPLALGGGILLLNFLHWMKHTTAAIPFGVIVTMAVVWVLVSLPFGAAGVFLGYRMDTIAVTAKVSSIPRLIPAEAGGKTFYYAILGSFVPFVACCVEMSYVLNAFWREEQMYMFGLLTFFLCIVAVLSAEVGIVVTYFTLRDEDYRWWWRSFGTLAASGLYLFCYSAFFLKRSLEIRLLSSMVLFLAYMLGVSVMFGLALGTISFLGSLWLVQRMYGAIKAD
jgi:transmembrane 9 superfamily member 2/4